MTAIIDKLRKIASGAKLLASYRTLSPDEARRILAERDRLLAVVEAARLALKWLANSVPVTAIDSPKPLPILATALANLDRPMEDS